MHSFRRLRFRHLLTNIELRLLDDVMAFDPRLHRPFESTASAPSLRASELDLSPLSFGAMAGAADQDSSSVKVVVRVRQFIKRGEFAHTVNFSRAGD
jgi:hypothetical protein